MCPRRRRGDRSERCERTRRVTRLRRLQHKEVFVPLAHSTGDAQADFGEALVVMGGVEQKAHLQCFDLPHSDDCFVIACSAENTEAFLEGHNQAFAYFGGVPRTILYDNMRIAAKEITPRYRVWPDWEALNAQLLECRKGRERKLWGVSENDR